MGKVKGMGMPSIMAFHRELAKKGFDVTYIYVGDSKTCDLNIECEGVKVHSIRVPNLLGWLKHIGVCRKLFSPLPLVMGMFPVYRYLRGQRDVGQRIVVYGHQWSGAILASILSKPLRVPNVTRLYGSLLPYHLGLCPQYSVGRFRRWWNFLRYWEEALAFLLPASKYVITDDGTLCDELFRVLKSDKSVGRLEYIGNGIDVDWEKWLACERDRSPVTDLFGNDAPVVVSPGRLTGWKRRDRIIEIADRIRATGRLVNFLILGNGSEEERLRREIEKRELGDRVFIKNDTPHIEMPRYLLAADAVLLTQDYSNLTNTLLESFVLERPVVSLDVGGIHSVAKDESNCLLVTLDGLLEQAPAAVLRILDEPELRKKLAQGCEQWREKHACTWEERVEVDATIIRTLLNDEGTSVESQQSAC